MDALTHSTIEERGAREISVRTTGYDKLRVTALLSAKADGTKLKPYILLPRKQFLPDLVEKYRSKVISKFEGTTSLGEMLPIIMCKALLQYPWYER